MIHPDEDTLLKSVLEILDIEEEDKVQVHIGECESCKKKYEQIKNQTDLFRNFEPEVEEKVLPWTGKKEIIATSWIKAAAILLIGFVMGYFAAIQSFTGNVDVVEQNLITKPLSFPSNDFTTCEQVDLSVSNK